MNRKQIIIMWVAIGVISLMCLFPPWVQFREGYDYRSRGRGSSTGGWYLGYVPSLRQSLGYRPIFFPPKMQYTGALPEWFTRIDTEEIPRITPLGQIWKLETSKSPEAIDNLLTRLEQESDINPGLADLAKRYGIEPTPPAPTALDTLVAKYGYQYQRGRCYLDYGRLIIQCLPVVFLAAAGIFCSRERPRA